MLNDAELGAEARRILQRKGGAQRSQALLALERQIDKPGTPRAVPRKAQFKGWGAQKAVKKAAPKPAPAEPAKPTEPQAGGTEDEGSTEPAPVKKKVARKKTVK
jgi:hypothetical protein